MFSSPVQARDEMFAHFDTAWTGVQLTIDLEVETRWQGIKEGDIPDGYFARVSTAGSGSNSGGFLQNGDGSTPQVFDTYGNLFVQIFAPISAEDAYYNGERLAIEARNIFMATETINGVWFRNARYVELADDGKFYRWNVSVEYQFSEAPRGVAFGEEGEPGVGGGW
jgi:hypothetical protein